ncbi:MAG: HAMP domain-containing sensor histidine kinase [Candidatus Sumerlaeota bacterium]|nr:HAMP domain-containing sensor histidine kinase [Candidatus Sumerlaeota bacterium]
MKLRLTIILALIILLPVGLLGWLGARVARYEREAVERRFEELMMSRLNDVDGAIQRFLEARSRQLLEITQMPSSNPDAIRQRVRESPSVRQIFCLAPDGRLIYPPPGGEMTEAEREFLARTRDIWNGRDLLDRPPDDQAAGMAANARGQNPALQGPQGQQRQQGSQIAQSNQNPKNTQVNINSPIAQSEQQTIIGQDSQEPQLDQKQQGASQESKRKGKSLEQQQQKSPVPQQGQVSAQSLSPQPAPQQGRMPRASHISHGWFVWYWGKGMNLLFWRREPSGMIWGAELDGVRLMADIIGQLPDTPVMDASTPPGRITLTGSTGETIYQWGEESGKGERLRASRLLSMPLSSWRLNYYAAGDAFGEAAQSGALFSMAAGLIAVMAAMIGLGVYFYRENARELREAAQRVTFVNQVSHELKTPLTNIRMYAEMLETALEEEEENEPNRRRVGIIVSESQRLSRLIANILTFSRQQRKKLSLILKPGEIDDVIARVLRHCSPSLESKGIKPVFTPGASGEVSLDADALEQILCNLISNVEKYAAEGGAMEVTSRLETKENGNRRAVITVSDQGPGIPEKQRENIFLPFVRLSDQLTEGASGAGIGLTIARALARLHGGDLRLIAGQRGATFELSLEVGASEKHPALQQN